MKNFCQAITFIMLTNLTIFMLKQFDINAKYNLCVFISTSLDNLLIDYQFTFSLLQEDDQHYTAINFMATPEEVSEFASCSQTKWFRMVCV